jgi:hypothetical protein
MPKAQAMIMPKKYFFDKDGNPLAFGKVYTYQAGTTIDKITYTTEDGDVANPNPVILNGEGYASIYLDGSYNIVVDDQNDNNIWTEDPVSSSIAEEWVGCQSANYISSTIFSVVDNKTDLFTEDRKVRVDNGTGSYFYASVISSSFSGGVTNVTLDDSIVQVGIIEACVSIVTPDSQQDVDDVIAKELGSYASLVFDTVADVAIGETIGGKTVTIKAGDRVIVIERNNAEFVCGAGAANGFNIIETSGSGVVATLENNGEVDLVKWGAVDGQNSSDAINAAAQYARDNSLPLVCNSGTFLLDSFVDLTGIKNVNLSCTFDTTALDETEYSCDVGAMSQGTGGTWFLPNFTSSNAGTFEETKFPQLRVVGTKGIEVHFSNMNFLQFYQDAADTNRSSNAYNVVKCNGIIAKLEVDSAAGTSWFNENKFFGGRFYQHIIKSDTYIHNHNKFYEPTFEGRNVNIDWNKASSNHIFGARFEGVAATKTTTATTISFDSVNDKITAPTNLFPFTVGEYINVRGSSNDNLNERYKVIATAVGEITVEAGSIAASESAGDEITIDNGAQIRLREDTDNNTIQQTWISSLKPREKVYKIVINQRDDGLGNDLNRLWSEQYNPVVILNVSGDIPLVRDNVASGGINSSTITGLLDNLEEVNVFARGNVYPGIESLASVFGSRNLAQSNKIPTKKGDIFGVRFKLTQGEVRYQVWTYDHDGVLLDDPDALADPAAVYQGGGYWLTNNLTLNSEDSATGIYSFNVENDDVGYIRIAIVNGSSGNTIIEYATAYYFEPPRGGERAIAKASPKPKNMALPSIPIQGHVPYGAKVEDSTGATNGWMNTFELVTKLTSAVANGGTSVTVDDVAQIRPVGNVANGDIVGVLLSDGTTHWSTVSGLSGNTFNISALTSPVGVAGVTGLAGATVVFNRWTAIP